ncbi:VCBS repeat-containing protein [candidate division KSB1 bacterium]|nr:VCBS repeat-containing protein [candidate division KSB1 bacterium]
MKILIAVLAVLLLAANGSAEKYDLKINWTLDVPSPDPAKMEPSAGGALLPYPDEKKPNSMVFTCGYGTMRVDGAGNILFSYTTSDRASIYLAIDDLDGDGIPEIVQPTGNGEVHCIDGAGKRIWKVDLNDQLYGFGAAVISDIDGNRKKEIFLNAREGNLYCLNYDGSLKWRFNAEARASSPAVGDIDGDGKAEIFYGTDVGNIFCLNCRGEYLWHTEIIGRAFGRSAPALADLNHDGRYEVLMPHSADSPDPAILCLDAHSGKFLWKGGVKLQNYVGTTIVDLDQDGKLEVMVVDKSNTISVFEDDGKTKWQTSLVGHGIFGAAAVADFDGDGHFEIVCGTRQTGPDKETMFLLNDQGDVLKIYKEGNGRNNSPLVADLNQDGLLEIYMANQHPAKIISYTLEGTQPGNKSLWSCWKRVPSNAGFHPSVSRKICKMAVRAADIPQPESEQIEPVFVGQNTHSVAIPEKYHDQALIAEIRLLDETGFIDGRLSWYQQAQESVEVPFYIPSLRKYQLTISIRQRQSARIIMTRTMRVSADGFRKDIDYIRKNRNELSQIVQRTEKTDVELTQALTGSFEQKEQLLLNQIDAVKQEGKSLSAPLLQLIEKNRNEVDEILRYARFLDRIRDTGNRELFYAWEDENPWDNVPCEQIYPEVIARDTLTLAVKALGNEIESRTLCISNLINQSHFVKVYVHDVTSDSGDKIKGSRVIQLREPIAIPDVQGMSVDQALPLLNQGNTLLLPPAATRKLWLSISTSELLPGNYTANIGIEAIGMTVSTQTIKLMLTVSPIAVPQKSEFAFCTWSYPGEFQDDDLLQKAIADLISHKVTVIPGIPNPRIGIDAQKQFFEDWSNTDKYLPLVKDHTICILFGRPHLSVPESVSLTENERKTFVKKCTRRFVNGLEKRGLTYDDWAVYIMDEPGLTGMSTIYQATEWAQEVKDNDPRIQCYVDPAGMVTPQSMKPFEKVIDIYTPQIDLLKKPDGELLAYFHRLKKTLWFYEAIGPSRILHPLGYYRVQPWLAFDYGLTGSGFWVYCMHANFWRKEQPNGEYAVVYNDDTNIIPSRRWEASRDGIEDYHLLMQTRREIARLKTGNRAQKQLAAEIEAYLDATVKRITRNVKRIESINRELIHYDVEYSYFIEAREKFMKYLEKLTAVE